MQLKGNTATTESFPVGYYLIYLELPGMCFGFKFFK